MSNPYFRFKQFTVYHHRSAMKVTTDSCLFGGWCAEEIRNAPVKLETALDIGTGTGLLSLMIAQKNQLQIDAVEMDAAAVIQANENVSASPWKNEIKVFEKDIREFTFNRLYDCIYCNPPFYEKELASTNTAKNLAHHGEGLRLQQLALLVQKQLNEEGMFFLLLPYKRHAEVENILHQAKLFVQKKIIVRQSVLHTPFRLLIKGGKQPAITENGELSIWNEQKQYTPEFVALLKDYYLYL